MANLRAKDFELGSPKVIGFKSAGSNVDGVYGTQVRWQTTNGNSLYLDPEPAGDIERELQELGVRFGEDFRLTRVKTSHGGSRWVVERMGDAGGHNMPARSERVVTMPPQQIAATQLQANSQPVTPMAARFSSADMVAIDTLIAAREYAMRKGLVLEIRCEDVRARAATIMIDQQKGGR